MLNKNFKIQLLGTLLFTVLLVFSSCQKEADTLAVIIVKNSYGQTIQGAEVTLDQEWTSTQGNNLDPNLKQVKLTDDNGRAEFTYKLEAILNVTVVKQSNNNVLTGSNVIRLLRGKTVSKTIEIN